jgi:lipopolysaccharide biosynthesis glycosyltransferase
MEKSSGDGEQPPRGADAVQIVFATDEGYVRQTITALHSIVRQTQADLVVHVVFTDISAESHALLHDAIAGRGADACFHEVDGAWLGNFPDSPHYSKSTFLKLHLPELLSSLPRCIYVDPDILVRHDIKDLWNLRMHGKPVAAVKDIDFAREHSERIRLPSGHTYFNAGVLMLDLEILRNIEFEDAAIRLAESEPERIIIVEQDILNILLANNASYLPLKWNYCPLWTDHGAPGSFQWRNIQTYYDEDEREAADRDPALVHFANIHKPWHSSLESIEHPFQEEYRRCDAEAHPDNFPQCHASARPALSCVLPICDADDVAFQTVTSLLSQSLENVEVVVVSGPQSGRVGALLETAARWKPGFKFVRVGNSTPAEALLAALRLVSAEEMIFVPSGIFMQKDFLARVAGNIFQSDPESGAESLVWTKESWWRFIIESEAARRAAELVCQSVDGYMVFYCTVLRAWMGDPEKVKPVPIEADAWDARRTPHVHAKDVLELREFLGYAIQRDRREAVAKTRSLLNCFRHLEPGEKWRFLAGLGR